MVHDLEFKVVNRVHDEAEAVRAQIMEMVSAEGADIYADSSPEAFGVFDLLDKLVDEAATYRDNYLNKALSYQQEDTSV